MAIRPEDLPKDPAALAEMVLAFDGENDDLRAEIATLKSLIFGARSERSAIICAEQLAFDLERTADAQPPANDDEPESDAPRAKRRKPRRNIGALPAHLPRVEQVIEPASTLCPCCTGQMHRIGEETSEALDRVPAWLRVLRTIRPKYACRACEGPIVQAPAPARLVEGGMATTALIAHIAAAKYAWQSTLYRQTQILAGHGVVVDRQTLARWMGSAAWMVKGLYDLQLKTMHRFERLFCDETPMPVLDPGRGRTKICQFWAHATDDRAWKGPAPPAVAYVFAGGRGKKEIMAQLAGFEGVLQVDGYAAYVSLAGDAKMSGKIRLAYCLVHARRNFVKVHKTTNSPFAREVIERIGSRLRDRGEDPRPRRRGAPRGAAGRDEAADGGVEGPSGRGEGRDLPPVDADQGDRLHARTLGGSDGVPGRRAARAGHQHGRAFDQADCNRKKEFVVQRRRRRGRDLGYSFFAS